jgi:thiol peroxidase
MGLHTVIYAAAALSTASSRQGINMTSTVTLGGNPFQVEWQFSAKGPGGARVLRWSARISPTSRCSSFAGQRKVLNIFPSIDTPTCATSVRKFNQEASGLPGIRWCSAFQPICRSRRAAFAVPKGLDKVVTLSTMRGREFLESYGVALSNGPLAGLAARAVVVLDADDRVLHSQLVGEIKDEPDYAAALQALT